MCAEGKKVRGCEIYSHGLSEKHEVGALSEPNFESKEKPWVLC